MEFQIIKAEQPIISVNFDEVKEALTKKLEEYKDIVVTEESLSGCKYAQKELASLRVDVDNNRKKIKKELSAPITKFEDQCKELIAMIEKAEQPIKDGIKVFDDKRREEKRQIALRIIEEECDYVSLSDKYKAQIEIKDKYMNLTATESDVREDIVAQIYTLRANQTAEEDRLSVIQSAIDRENRILQYKLTIEQFEYAINNGRPTSEILDEISKIAEGIKAAESNKTEVKPVEEPVIEHKENEKMYSVTFTITGNADEMRLVSSFLKNNKIDYKTLEQKEI